MPLRQVSGPHNHQAPGINIIGYFDHPTGVGQTARSLTSALRNQNVSVEAVSAEGGPHTGSLPHAASLFCVNADSLDPLSYRLNPLRRSARHTIGWWWWELASFPTKWHHHFKKFDELWVGSNFIRDALQPHTSKRVITMGVPVEPEPIAAVNRASFGIPERRFIWLAMFDGASPLPRKNPYGTIEAYRRAFGPYFKETVLVLKAINVPPEQRERLLTMVQSVGGILLDQELPSAQVHGLQKLSDGSISLHRSEGFGLTIAEAMYWGKPVIATQYGGPTDYLTEQNSWPISYYLTPLSQPVGPYEASSLWAEPDLEEAAHRLRYVIAMPTEAAKRGTAASEYIRQQYHPATVAQRMLERLRMLG